MTRITNVVVRPTERDSEMYEVVELGLDEHPSNYRAGYIYCRCVTEEDATLIAEKLQQHFDAQKPTPLVQVEELLRKF